MPTCKMCWQGHPCPSTSHCSHCGQHGLDGRGRGAVCGRARVAWICAVLLPGPCFVAVGPLHPRRNCCGATSATPPLLFPCLLRLLHEAGVACARRPCSPAKLKPNPSWASLAPHNESLRWCICIPIVLLGELSVGWGFCEALHCCAWPICNRSTGAFCEVHYFSGGI
jgi:hypothetical protein